MILVMQLPEIVAMLLNKVAIILIIIQLCNTISLWFSSANGLTESKRKLKDKKSIYQSILYLVMHNAQNIIIIDTSYILLRLCLQIQGKFTQLVERGKKNKKKQSQTQKSSCVHHPDDLCVAPMCHSAYSSLN